MTLKHILQGRFMKHPLHPMLVHLPIGLWVVSLIFDVAYMATSNPSAAFASFWLILVGIASALIAAMAGLADLLDLPKNTLVSRIAWTHAGLNVLVVILYAVNLLLRGDQTTPTASAVTGTELVLNIVSIGFLSISGYLGGTLVFRHGIGLRPEMNDRQAREDINRAA